jgi:hypothetical protein
MTDEIMNLRTLVEKTPDADLSREMISFAAQRLMELEVESQTGAGYSGRRGKNMGSHVAACPRRDGRLIPLCRRSRIGQLPT